MNADETVLNLCCSHASMQHNDCIIYSLYVQQGRVRFPISFSPLWLWCLCLPLLQVDSSETLSDSDTEGKALTEVHSVGVQVEDDKRYQESKNQRKLLIFEIQSKHELFILPDI